jgi:hypothetical protein
MGLGGGGGGRVQGGEVGEVDMEAWLMNEISCHCSPAGGVA